MSQCCCFGVQAVQLVPYFAKRDSTLLVFMPGHGAWGKRGEQSALFSANVSAFACSCQSGWLNLSCQGPCVFHALMGVAEHRLLGMRVPFLKLPEMACPNRPKVENKLFSLSSYATP